MSFLKIGSAELLLSFCSAFALYGTQVFHFDSPEEVGRFLNRKNPEAYFESGEKAAGAGALKASGFHGLSVRMRRFPESHFLFTTIRLLHGKRNSTRFSSDLPEVITARSGFPSGS